MPPIKARTVRPRVSNPPTRRSERIRARTEAAERAAALAAVAAMQATPALIPRNRPGNNRALQNFLSTSGVLASSQPPAATGASTTGEAALPPLSLVSGPSRGRAAAPQASGNSKAADRIKRDLILFHKDQPEGCQVELEDGNLFRWKATITGPAGTPYEGGVFRLMMLFHHNHPFMPPKVFFLNKLYHVNVARTGSVCMDILASEWSPALTGGKILLSIISLLGDPNPDDPLQPVLADLYKRKRHVYDENARLWTLKYAKPDEDDQPPPPTQDQPPTQDEPPTQE